MAMAMAMASVARAASKKIILPSSSSSHLSSPSSGARGLHSSVIRKYGGDDYMHAPHMYNLPAMKNRKLKMGLAVGSVVVIGTVVPIVAVLFQQKKTQVG